MCIYSHTATVEAVNCYAQLSSHCRDFFRLVKDSSSDQCPLFLPPLLRPGVDPLFGTVALALVALRRALFLLWRDVRHPGTTLPTPPTQ